MILLHAITACVVIACALQMILSRNLVRILLGLALLATGVNVMLFVAGGSGSGGRQPPLIAGGLQRLGASTDPTSQALILTAIVIGFALTVVLATVVLRGWRGTRSLDARDLVLVERCEWSDPADAVETGQ